MNPAWVGISLIVMGSGWLLYAIERAAHAHALRQWKLSLDLWREHIDRWEEVNQGLSMSRRYHTLTRTPPPN